MIRNPRGSVLVTTLVLLAFLAISLALLHRRIFRLAQLRHEEEMGRRTDEALWQEASSALAASTGSKRNCTGESGMKSICYWRSGFNPESGLPSVLEPRTGFEWQKLPIWSVSPLDRAPYRCLDLMNPPRGLTPSAALSERSCGNLPDAASIDGNIFASDAAITRRIVWISGALKAELLSVRVPATIFAGGDILINRLEAEAAILLISATGEIVIDAAPPGSISAISPRAIYLPPGAAAPEFQGELPPTLPFIVLGRTAD